MKKPPLVKLFHRVLTSCIAYCTTALAISIGASVTTAQPLRQRILPSQTDGSITSSDKPHIVISDSDVKPGPLLVWLSRTGGVSGMDGTGLFFKTALANGYRIISLSYIDTPAVAQVCIGHKLTTVPGCSAKFRQKRVFGENTTNVISDQPQDAIVHRLTALLQYLALMDQRGHWEKYLAGNSPKWSRIVLAGQSQGGGMAEFLAKRVLVERVIAFSGGWDYSMPNKLAKWYSWSSVTPKERWYGTYNANEPEVAMIAATYLALEIPSSHQFKLTLPAKFPHGDGYTNPAYQDIWNRMLSGR